MYKNAKDRTWIKEHSRQSEFITIDDDGGGGSSKRVQQQQQQSFETPVKEGKPDVKTFRRKTVVNSLVPARNRQAFSSKKSKKKSEINADALLNILVHKDKSELHKIFAKVRNSNKRLSVVHFLYNQLMKSEKEEFAAILLKKEEIEKQHKLSSSWGTMESQSDRLSWNTPPPQSKTQKQPSDNKFVIPKKCQRDLDEFQMHTSYIEDGVWESRDKTRADEIRARYPKKGNIAGVYKFTNLVNGKSYIGHTKNVWNRLRDHLGQKGLEHNQADLQRAIRKYGIDKFEFEVLIDDKQDLLMKKEEERLIMEALYVKKYNSYLNGYNTEDTAQALGEAMHSYHSLDYCLL
jgi:predicted GIY-YIG superfamily endonuclease